MNKLIRPCKYIGSIKATPSKSYMQRAIAIALLADGETVLTNPCSSDDSQAALGMAINLGATIEADQSEIKIKGTKKIKNNLLFAGESGLGIRCFIPVSSLFSDEIVFSGEGSLKTRPLSMLEKPLKELGVRITTDNGYLPVKVQGPINGGDIVIDGSISSQVLTGMLIALPKAKNSSNLTVNNLKSIPYIDMTIDILKEFGVNIVNKGYKEFIIEGNQTYQGKTYEIEGDWSGAAFHLVGGAIGGSVEITNINPNSLQADKAILQALELAGAEVSISSNCIKINKGQLKAFTFDATHCPDLFPPLSNLAATCKGTSIIKGVSRLVHKESNRALALQQEWKKLGIRIDLVNDEMHITGGQISGGEIDSHNDHRIAMMGAIACIKANGQITIRNAKAINKSYPTFFEDFKKLAIEIN